MPDTATRLETLYPAFGDQIKSGLTKGFSEADIEKRIQGVIKGLTDEGYDQQDILKFVQPAAREEFATPGTLEGAKKWIGQAISGSAGSQSPESGVGQFVREAGRGFTRGATLGYAGKPASEVATPTEQVGSAAGEFAGAAGPFVKGFQAAKAGLNLLPGAGPVANLVKTYLAAMGSGVASSAGSEQASGNRLGAAVSTATDPYMQLGALGGAAVAGLAPMRSAIRSGDPMSRAAEGMTALLDKSSQDKVAEAPPQRETPQVRKAVQDAAVVDKWMRAPDKALLEQSWHDTVYGNQTPGLETAIEMRAKTSQAFSQAMASNIIEAGAKRDEIKGIQPEGERARGTAAEKDSISVLKAIQENGLEADLSGFGPNDLQAAATALSQKMQGLETAARRTPKMNELYDRLQQATVRINEEVNGRAVDRAAKGSEPSSAVMEPSSLTVDDVRAADRVQYLGTSDEGSQVVHRVNLFSKYPGNEYLSLGEAIVPDKEFQQLSLADKMFKEAPPKIISEAPPSPEGPAPLGARAARLFKPTDTISAPRIARALRVSDKTAEELANQVRSARGELAPSESTVGAQEYEGATGQPNVDRAIQGFTAKRDQMLQSGAKKDSKFIKLYQQAIDELQASGKLSDELKKQFGITPKKVVATTPAQVDQVDLGGAENPVPGATVVDNIPEAKFRGYANPGSSFDNPYVQADLGKAQASLPQGKNVEVSQLLRYIQTSRLPIVADNIAKATQPGGIVRIFDYPKVAEPVVDSLVARGYKLVSKELVEADEANAEAWAYNLRAPSKETTTLETQIVPEPTSLAPTADLPPSSEAARGAPDTIAKPVSSSSAAQEGTHQVLVYKGDKLYRQYHSTDLQTASDLKGMVDAFLEAKGLTNEYSTKLQELPKVSSASEPREGKSRRVASTGLGKDRVSREIPMGLDVEQALLKKKYGRELTADEVRMEEAQANPAPVYSMSAVEALAGQKGLVVKFDTKQGAGLTIDLMGDTGSELRARDLKTATEFLLQLPDKASRASLDKTVRGELLTQQDRLELDKFASEQHKLETRVSEAPKLTEAPPSSGEPEMPNISGGAGGVPLTTQDKLALVAQAKKMTANDGLAFVDHVSKLFNDYPGLEAWWLSEMEAPSGKLAFINPVDYVAMPQFSSNPGIRTIAKDAAFLHEIPKFSEMRQWTDYYNKHWGDLTEVQQKETWQVMARRKDLATVKDPLVVRSIEAAKAFVQDVGSRLEIGPEWFKYLSNLIDKQKMYESYKNLITGYAFFEDLPKDTQMRLGGSENRFQMVKRAFDKNANYEDLPKDVKRTFNKDLVQWYTDTQYEQLPEKISDMVPKEMWETFSISGGFPLVENWNAVFRKIMPAIMGHIYTEPLVEKWKPVIDSLPGNTNGTTTKAYLTKWLALTQGSAERSGISQTFDGLTSKIEAAWGKSLSDPDFIGRLASRTALATYQSTLGLALDTGVVNMFQTLNTWAESGRVTKGIAGYLSRNDVSKLYKQMPEGVGILEEMSYHQLQGADLGGIGLPRFLERFGIPQDALKRWDAWITPKVMHPMHVTENILRGTAMLAGLEEAATMGLDLQTAMRLGVGRMSQVVPNLALTEGHLHALDLVAKTQFAYEKVFQSPYMQGPLTKLSTIFWSYPTKGLQFESNGMGQAIMDAVRQPGYAEISKVARYTGLLGLTIGGAWAGTKVGINLDNIFGTGLFPRLVSIPLQVAGTMYQAVLGREPVQPKDMQQMWKNLVYMLGVPGERYAGKAWDAAMSVADGYEHSQLGQRTFETSTFGEMARMLGLEYGRSYEQRTIAKTIMETEVKLGAEKKEAMSKAIYGSLTSGFQPDLSAVEKFNEKWGTMYPGTQITGDELAHFAQQGAKPSVERLGTPALRQGVKSQYGYQP